MKSTKVPQGRHKPGPLLNLPPYRLSKAKTPPARGTPHVFCEPLSSHCTLDPLEDYGKYPPPPPSVLAFGFSQTRYSREKIPGTFLFMSGIDNRHGQSEIITVGVTPPLPPSLIFRLHTLQLPSFSLLLVAPLAHLVEDVEISLVFRLGGDADL